MSTRCSAVAVVPPGGEKILDGAPVDISSCVCVLFCFSRFFSPSCTAFSFADVNNYASRVRVGNHAAEVLPALARAQVRTEGARGYGTSPRVGATGGTTQEEREGRTHSSRVREAHEPEDTRGLRSPLSRPRE